MSFDAFSGGLDFDRPIHAEPGNRAFFGRNVLQGLLDGIDDFVNERQPRWERHTYRIGAPVLLGCSPWVNDHALQAAVEALPGACIVISKQPSTQADSVAFQRLRAINQRTSGIELRALSGLGHLAPKVGGKPRIIGPYDRIHEKGERLSTFRTVGFRKTGPTQPPIAHAKLALLGNICWTDEHPAGGVDDYVWFSPRRLWVSSANFTFPSRRSIEFGYWTEDPDLRSAVAHFLVSLIGASEDLDSPANAPDPELAPVDLDGAAMAEAAAEYLQAREEAGWDPDEDDVES